jgi:hypothetical protein
MQLKRQARHSTPLETANNEVCEKSFCNLLGAVGTKLRTALSAYLRAVDRGRVDRNGLERTERAADKAAQHQGHHPASRSAGKVWIAPVSRLFR